MNVIIKLEKHLNQKQCESFREQARLHGRTLSEHAAHLLFSPEAPGAAPSQDGLGKRTHASDWSLTGKKKWYLLLGLVLFFAVSEVVCRYWVGLGDPPLSIAHPAIEYMFKPSCTYSRFGNRFSTNAYGMRSDDISSQRQGNEVRLLVLGDSIPNGGNLTDQDELATEILKKQLGKQMRVPVYVGNVSAGSWGPPNLLAYVKQYGTFEADAAVIVLNREDIDDFPTFAPLNPHTHPTVSPHSALGELCTRYALPRLAAILKRTPQAEKEKEHEVGPNCLPELGELIEKLKADGVVVAVLYHPSRREVEVDGNFKPDRAYDEFAQYCDEIGVPFFCLDQRYKEAVRSGQNPFRDGMHPNAYGQALMAEEIMGILQSQGIVSQWSERN
ncbi:SGNH/GDSL hydrolase family protein [Ruficoccus sp. ZRK36]|uniref:SGNH/GDSL hydrolase family protein n=1 Tax=Ruficoccus sp. ZRK36 TaxID=2866311 RepID=UPI001C7388B0|nr:SGNH/GDSL hydrolase family protein [Ruficoccus sp. ZRK36]QYY34504.1 hypothetical protein K0V07_09300 [Ruficoccus sp. ZRK36]